jgi:hypothetical protein
MPAAFQHTASRGSVVCLRCGTAYRPAATGLRVIHGDGCPSCGYLGWTTCPREGATPRQQRRRRWLAAGLSILAGLVLAGAAHAGGGRYSISGGTQAERRQVTHALEASAFDWGLVPGRVTIHIVGPLAVSHSTRGEIWLDARLLDAGTFSWGVVQMEYAQQVQLSLLDAPLQARLTTELGGRQWCYENPSLPVAANACERFAAMLAWAYWPSPENCMQPAGHDTWTGSIDARAFRQLLTQTIGAPASPRVTRA